MISQRLLEDMKKAMKAGDKQRLSVIRMLRAELKNASIAAGKDLEAPEEEKVLSAYAKKRKEAAEKYREGGREDMATREEEEYDITVSYLPPRMSEDELRQVISKHIDQAPSSDKKAFGQIMKAVMAEVGSRAEGSEVSKLLKGMLNTGD